jgi:hypothetical protein
MSQELAGIPASCTYFSICEMNIEASHQISASAISNTLPNIELETILSESHLIGNYIGLLRRHKDHNSSRLWGYTNELSNLEHSRISYATS